MDTRNMKCFHIFKKYHATLGIGDAFGSKKQDALAVLDENFKFVEFTLSDIKWISADIIRGLDENGSKKMDARLKLQSVRSVDTRTLMDMPDVAGLLDPTKKPMLRQGPKDLYVQQGFEQTINFVRFKEIEMYRYDGPIDLHSHWQDVKVELAEVTEFSKLDTISKKFNSVRTIHELRIKPSFPGLDMEEGIVDDVIAKAWGIIQETLAFI